MLAHCRQQNIEVGIPFHPQTEDVDKHANLPRKFKKWNCDRFILVRHARQYSIHVLMQLVWLSSLHVWLVTHDMLVESLSLPRCRGWDALISLNYC